MSAIDAFGLSNYDFARSCASHDDNTPLHKLTVWGGMVANCSDSSLSKIVDTHAASLRSVLYKPDHTKGGALIRPKYHRGDRGGSQVFPALTDMAIRLWPSLQPQEFGWRLPALKQLTLLVDLAARERWMTADDRTRRTIFDRGEDCYDWETRALTDALHDLLNHEDPKGFVPRLAAASPALECVKLELCTSEDPTRTRLRVLTVCRAGMPWAAERLFHLVARKPDPSAVGHDAVERCHDALRQGLPILLPLLKAYEGWVDGWEIRLPLTPPSSEALEKLGLGRLPDAERSWPGWPPAGSKPRVETVVDWLRIIGTTVPNSSPVP